MHDLHKRIDEEFKVRVLRGKCSAPPAKLRGEGGFWREIVTDTGIGGDAHDSGRSRDREEGLRQQAEALGVDYQAHDGDVTGGGASIHVSMAGSRGLGVERVFWNERDKELVAVVWLGPGLSGFPGVAHGGAIATVLADKTALAAELLRESENQQGSGMETMRYRPDPSQLDLRYLKPTHANDFYLIRAIPRFAVTDGLGTVIKSLGKEIEIEGKLETMKGVLCVEVKTIVPVADSPGHGPSVVKAATSTGSSWRSWLGLG